MTSRPITNIPSTMTNAPGRSRAGRERIRVHVRSVPPVSRSAPENPSSWMTPRKPTYATAMPRGSAPRAPSPPCRDPTRRTSPPPGAANGRSQRPAPKNGTIVSRHQSVSVPVPAGTGRSSVTAPSTSRTMPDDRRADGRRQPDIGVWQRQATRDRREAAERVRSSVAGGSPPQTSTTTGKTIGRRFVCSYR